MEKKEQKKLKNLPSGFFTSLKGLCLESFGTDKQRLGTSLLTLAEKYGVSINKSRSNREGMANHVISLELIVPAKTSFQLTPGWEDKVSSMFPKETLVFPEEIVEQQITKDTEEPEPLKEEVIPEIKTFRDYYIGYIKTAWSEDSDVEQSLLNYTVKCMGRKPSDGWFKKRLTYITTKILMVEGNESLLIHDEWEAALQKVNILGKRFTFEPESSSPKKKKAAPVVKPTIEKPQEIKELVTDSVQTIKIIAPLECEGILDNPKRIMRFPETGFYEVPFNAVNQEILKQYGTIVISKESKETTIPFYRGQLEALQREMEKLVALTH